MQPIFSVSFLKSHLIMKIYYKYKLTMNYSLLGPCDSLSFLVVVFITYEVIQFIV